MKIIYNLLKYKNILLSITLFLIIVSFFFVHAEQSFDSVSGRLEAEEAVMFQSSGKIVQKFNVDNNALLTHVLIQFATYSKENKGTLQAALYENERLIEQWEIDTASLADNRYRTFWLEKPFETNRECSYRIELSQHFEGDNAIAVWTALRENGSCYRNGSLLYGQSICYRLGFQDTDLRSKVLAAAFVIAILFGILVLLGINEKKLMTGIFILLGCIYMWLCVPGMAPDEENHFLRAFEISCGNLISKGLYGGTIGGDYLPAEVRLFTDPEKELDWSKREMITFSNTALYAPVSYLPQAVGIKTARYFTNNVSKIFYGGKIGNFLANMLLCLWALYRIPFGRKILFMILTFPMTMQEMVSMSTDGFTTSLCLAFTAYVLYVSYNEEERIRKKDIFILALLSVLIALCKIVYIVLVLLVFLIPNEKIGGRRKWISFKFGVSVIAAVFNLVWLKISSGYLMEFQPGVDAGKQMYYVLTNMGEFYEIVIRSIIKYGNYWIQTMFGSLMGALSIKTSPIMCVVFLIFFLYEICNYKRLEVKPHKYDQLIMMLVFLGGTGLIFASLYVQWTPWKNEIVEGIQGRYFIPLIIFPAFWVTYYNDKKKKEVRYIISNSEKGTYYYMILLVLNGIAILDIIRHSLYIQL